MHKKVSVIIPAAGTGSRMGHREKKQFIALGGIPILIRTLRVFDQIEAVEEVIVVTGKEDIQRVEELIGHHHIQKCKAIVAGGKRRQDSVFNALKVVSGEIVMIHDGARPFVEKRVILEHLEKIQAVKGLITCVPTKDTIKVVSGDLVEKTLDRSTLVNVQTPQTFYTEMLREAYQQDFLEVTDDASLMEQYGVEVHTVMGSYNNIKITTPEDLKLGEIILRGDA